MHLFHLSMPHIAANEAHPQAHLRPCTQPRPLAASTGQWHNRKAQHRHHTASAASKAKVNLNAKLEAVRKLSENSADLQNNCDSGLGTPISLMDEAVASGLTSASSSQASGASHLRKWRSSMSGKTKEKFFTFFKFSTWKTKTLKLQKYKRVLPSKLCYFGNLRLYKIRLLET